MAAASVTTKQLTWGAAGAPTMATPDATDGALICPGADESTLLVLTASGALTATIKAGNGIQGTSDLTVTFAAAGTQYVAVESGKYLIAHGDNAGCIRVIPSTTGLTVGCIVLPR